jgi:hypothetical protein
MQIVQMPLSCPNDQKHISGAISRASLSGVLKVHAGCLSRGGDAQERDELRRSSA